LKPTYGSVDLTGVFPLSWSLDTLGPLAKRVPDAAAMLNVLTDRAGLDATAEIGQGIEGLRIGVARGYFFERVQHDVIAAVERSAELLRSLGAEVIDTPWADAAAARAVSFVINRVETVAVHGEGIRTTPELYGEELALRVRSNALYPAEGYVRALRARTAIRSSIAALFNEHRLDAIIAPTLPGTACPADDLFVPDDEGNREPVGSAYTRFTMPFNATGQPALSVPCGRDRSGLPIGLQIIARPHAETRLCRIGAAFEQAAGYV
jgi:aspartyl-tRNA(Asn)/glutamyl-tRNA(Gln) amidotransferase subunit A